MTPLELELKKTSATGYLLPVHTSNIGPGTCCGNSTCDATSSDTPQPSSSLHPNIIQLTTVRGPPVRPTVTQSTAVESVSGTGVIAAVVVMSMLVSPAGPVIL